eukprot:403376081
MVNAQTLFAGISCVCVPYIIYKGYQIFGYADQIKKEAPECTQTNPYFAQLFLGTIALLIIVMIPVQAVAKSLFMKALPVGKFPIGTKGRDLKAQVIAERVFRFFVYCSTTLALFWSCKQSNFLHKYLLGSETDPQFFINYPCQPVPRFLDDLYVIKLAYHCFEAILTMVFHRDRRDFSEFLLHHLLTIAMVSYSYFTNFLPVGSIVMIIMDFTDIFVAMFKMAVDVNETMQNTLFILMLVTWSYFRIYFFPVHVIKPFYDQAWSHPHEVAAGTGPFLIIFLCVLQILNVFWLGLMLKGFFRRILSKKILPKNHVLYKVE